jgi:hypothetical protein
MTRSSTPGTRGISTLASTLTTRPFMRE